MTDSAKRQKWSDNLSRFAEQQRRLLGTEAQYPLQWFVANVPYVELPDPSMEEMYYFRWFSFQKHLKKTPDGFVITEYMPEVPWAAKFNTINAAAEFHLREARWLRDTTCADEYAAFWAKADASPRLYSFAYASAVLSLVSVSNDRELLMRLFPALVRNYEVFAAEHQDANGLFWQIDDRDGMEFSSGGSGYRPSINSYMYGEAAALSAIATLNGDTVQGAVFDRRATQLRTAARAALWNENQHFYETIDRITGLPAGVRELIGYLPWYYGMQRPSDEVAWPLLFDAKGFWGKYGPSSVERTALNFMKPAQHETLWNGPSWPFATTQTLTALANYLDEPGHHIVTSAQYRKLLGAYVLGQHLRLNSGEVIPWIDEDVDPDTGDWIARNQLAAEGAPDAKRGQYYNHSAFADIIFSGLLGIRPDTSNVLQLRPLVDPQWPYYCVLGLPYHGHVLDLLFDQSGKRYGVGKGFVIRRDGKVIFRSRTAQGVRVQWLKSDAAPIPRSSTNAQSRVAP